MNLSNESVRPKTVRFVDVSLTQPRRPAWLSTRSEDAVLGPEDRVSPLMPPEEPSHARPALAPVFDSVRPPAMPRSPSLFPSAMSRPPSQFPGSLSGSPSQYPGAGDASFPSDPGLGSGMPQRRRDTLIEDLVPRAEEEAVSQISAALAEFVADRARLLEGAQAELVELVKVICRRVVLREMTASPHLIEGLVQEGLEALGRGDRVTVKLGPFFADSLLSISENLQHKGIDCVVLIDPAVGKHGCQLETELGRVDESIETRLNLLLDGLDSVS
jgi:hypothetical protein